MIFAHKKLFIISLLIFYSSLSWTLTFPMPSPVVVTSIWGNTYFVMTPKNSEYENDKLISEIPAFGKAFKLNSDGESELLWETSGWYAYKSHMYLSNEGKFLVRIGHWAVASNPQDQKLAVAFYDKGIEIKRYSIKDLVKGQPQKRPNPLNVMYDTQNFIHWEHGQPRLNSDEFEIKTIDGVMHTFDIKTGELIHPEIVDLKRNQVIIYTE